MPFETPFRIAVLVICGLVTLTGGWFRLRARTGEPISHREEGLVLTIIIRLLGVCFWITTIAYLLNATWIEWVSLPLPLWLRWCGVVCGTVCSGFLWWTLTNLGKNLTDTVVTRSNAVLVTTGPYRWIRHPFYFSVFLLMLAIALMSANWLIGLIGLSSVALVAGRVKKEERKLIEKFGDQYREYMAVTGRFLPKISS
jgi:protein-S-isoprenylcysteine O-methyltransferase Ste14